MLLLIFGLTTQVWASRSSSAHAAGPLTAVELAVDGEETVVEAALSRARNHALGLKVSERVTIRARKTRRFHQPIKGGA